MKHPDRVALYPGTLDDLATELGDLRYDCLAEFLHALAAKIAADGEKDGARGRLKLAATLRLSATSLTSSAAAIDEAWRISAPHMPSATE